MAGELKTKNVGMATSILAVQWPSSSVPSGYTADTVYYFDGTSATSTFTATGAQTLAAGTAFGADIMQGDVQAAFFTLGLAGPWVALYWPGTPTVGTWTEIQDLPFDGSTFVTVPTGTNIGVASGSFGYSVAPFLYADALDHLTDFLGGSSSDATQRLTRRCILNAYQRFMGETDWRILIAHGRVNLTAPYDTGTIAFDLTGGSSERLLTLSSGTWPTWARYGHVKIDNVIYEVDQRLSNSQITLDATLCPAADVAAGTSYTLYRNAYPLANDFKRLLEPTTEHVRRSMYVSPEQFIWLERHRRQQGYPFRWTIMPSKVNVGQWNVLVYGYPTTAETLDFIYQRSMRPLIHSGFDTRDMVGTVSVSSGSGNVTGTSTTFNANMVGSYMRFSSDTSTLPDGLGSLNPFAEQRKILSVTDTTHLVLDSAVDNTYTSTKYRISDPLEFPPYMLDAFLRCLEWQYATIGRLSDVSNYYGMYRQALIMARENDSVPSIRRSVGGTVQMADQGWRSGLASNVT